MSPTRKPPKLPALPGEEAGHTRREFLRAAGTAAGMAALSSCSSIEELLGTHFQELSPEALAARLREIEVVQSARFGKQVRVSAAPARERVLFGYGLDLSRCVGCRRCVHACVRENNTSRGNPEVQWIKVLELDKEYGVDLAHADAYYDAEAVPRPGHFYMPVSCQQCRKPACVKVCPASATWKEPDGIVVVDYDWCVGCRCCMSACPYGARRFNWSEPEIPADEMNPDTHYLGNRPREKCVVEKCTFCIQRVRQGRYPACVEVCPMGARKFGNLLDPNSEIRRIMEMKRVFILKEEIATRPQFYYFYG
ncbi:MAG TPA: 4Fe-4S dicluster domain-containing protein [Anaeromyxobacteraceae bacterium]|nr:4Fe-4S dicluster domain-containing protein [Anaeromyxobacteraceae bacterium]